ncbi:hypothetical protein HMPREF6123_2230 [Oribacterium sinus F0268]|uniref:Uncharacterized protein n=1 Tax=Oribacterium sinus F0268 TaxID=585501 RepID=C2L0G1_9FIRM|nr:hypothetical protein HMPREF6123_2230 [Oribacterium sinus F0268]
MQKRGRKVNQNNYFSKSLQSKTATGSMIRFLHPRYSKSYIVDLKNAFIPLDLF